MPPLYRQFETQAQIDAEYNPSLALSANAQPMQHFVQQAERARQQLPCLLDLPYGPTRAETLDIFPAAAANAPVFIFLHGGYWRAFSSKDFSGVALGLQPLGITTVLVNYALCPQVNLDEITRQTRAASAWVLRHIAQYGGDPRRVAIGGHSAGAHLSAMNLHTPWAPDYGLPTDPFAAAL
ncbi:MAG: alpha/beta hydrolase, partial [Rhodoferax sp.]